MDVSHFTVIRAVLVAFGSLPFVSWSLSPRGIRALDPWFRFQCHGLAERTLAAGGHHFPVCSRCLGIYGGVLMAAIVARPRLSASQRSGWIVAAAMVMVADVMLRDTTHHAVRLLTGAFLAWPIALTLIAQRRP